MGSYIVGRFFNFIGGATRWLWGSIYRTVLRKKKFTFQEYINGPNEKSYYDEMGHGLNNFIIGAIVFFTIIIPLINLIDNYYR